MAAGSSTSTGKRSNCWLSSRVVPGNPRTCPSRGGTPAPAVYPARGHRGSPRSRPRRPRPAPRQRAAAWPRSRRRARNPGSQRCSRQALAQRCASVSRVLTAGRGDRLEAAGQAAQRDKRACGHTWLDIALLHREGIHDPGRDPRTGADVGRQNVDCQTQSKSKISKM